MVADIGKTKNKSESVTVARYSGNYRSNSRAVSISSSFFPVRYLSLSAFRSTRPRPTPGVLGLLLPFRVFSATLTGCTRLPDLDRRISGPGERVTPRHISSSLQHNQLTVTTILTAPDVEFPWASTDPEA